MRKVPLLACVLLFITSATFAQKESIIGFNASQVAEQQQWEKRYDQVLSNEAIDKMVKEMSAKPHEIGSAGGREVAVYMQQYFQKLGFDAQIETLYTLFSKPKERLLEMNGPAKFKALLDEPALKEDATSSMKKDQLPIYNCWSADGDVTAPLVFVNYGLPEDYEKLRQLGISVKGKIVIAKYGRSWRGIKPKVAQENGAVGCLIYSDPKDDGYYQGEVYPKGAFKNEFGAQRGSVLDMPVYPGDPMTPGYGHTKDAKTVDKSAMANLLKIPVLPISYHDAAPLLKSLEGPVAPESWRGALPFTYHVGPSVATVHLKLNFDWSVVPILNVIATLKGTTYPDEWVVRGNHHDAWVFGANDPISGMAALMEEAKGISEMVRQGWKPKRTIVFCGWDGEEPGLLGSTEWVETHAKELQEKAVVYINSDGNGRGFFEAAGSHALENMVNEVATSVIDPQTKVNIWERRKSQLLTSANSLASQKSLLSAKTLPIGALGSGSDYSPFFQHLGIPSLNLGFGGEDDGGEYHSIYDSYDHYKRFKDPNFDYGVALAKFAGRVTMRMANAEVLPFDFKTLHKTIQGYVTDLQNATDQLRESTKVENQLIREGRYVQATDPTETYFPPLIKEEVPYFDFSALQNALAKMELEVNALNEAIKQNKKETSSLNQKLYQAEQQLLLAEGLPRRPWYKHSIYAPGFYTGYGVKTMPGIREAIEQRNWEEANKEIQKAAAAILHFSNYLNGVTASLK